MSLSISSPPPSRVYATNQFLQDGSLLRGGNGGGNSEGLGGNDEEEGYDGLPCGLAALSRCWRLTG
jgi:hypothetical protein